MAPVAEIIAWDVINWSRCLPYWQPWVADLDRRLSRVLVLGERNGGISLWLASLGFDVVCTDFRMPGPDARQLHRRHGVDQRVQYAEVDVFSMPFPEQHFDVVACKSVIGGLKRVHDDASTRSLEQQKVAVEEVRRVLKTGGVFLGAENLTGTRWHAAARHARHKGRVGWRHLQVAEIAWLFDSYESCEQRCWGFLGTHWPARYRINRAAGAVDACLSRVLPADWLYISFIRARK